MTIKVYLTSCFLIGIALPCSAQIVNGSLMVYQNATGELIATASAANIPVCALSGYPPTFSLKHNVITVVQGLTPSGDVQCFVMAPYNVTIDFGRLPPGDYTVSWNYPALTTEVTVTGDPGYQIGPDTTGSWFDPAQSGHGFSIEVLPTDPPQLLATWLVFDTHGNLLWLTGTGSITGNEGTVLAWQESGPGALFPPQFNANLISASPWGQLKFTFNGCNSGNVAWHSFDSQYADGSIPLTRLTMPAGLTCTYVGAH